jgi:hypothetical protein
MGGTSVGKTERRSVCDGSSAVSAVTLDASLGLMGTLIIQELKYDKLRVHKSMDIVLCVKVSMNRQ